MDFQELKKQHETEASNFSKGKIYYVFGSTETEIINKLKEYDLEPNQVISIELEAILEKNITTTLIH